MRAVFEAHGEILTVPAEKGDIRNLTNTPGVMERTPAWSPDGQSIAYFSDESGEYALHIKSQTGEGETSEDPAGRQIGILFRSAMVARQQAHRLQRQSAEFLGRGGGAGKLTKVDTDYISHTKLDRDFAWSADSKWIAFASLCPTACTRFRPVFARERQEHAGDRRDERRPPPGVRPRRPVSLFHRQHQLRAHHQRLDMTSDEHDVTSSVYLAVLANNVGVAAGAGERRGEAPAKRPRRKDATGGGGGAGGAAERASQTGAHRFRRDGAAHRGAACSRRAITAT